MTTAYIFHFLKQRCLYHNQGISVHAPDLLQNPELVKQIKDMNLVLFCWGDDNNNSDNIKKLKQAGVDGVIYDRSV